MKRFVAGVMAMAALLGASTLRAVGQRLTAAAAVSGVVRDAHGTPQMGALVELLGSDTAAIAVAFSDSHGRYILPAVRPGHYQLRATAAFFLPVLHNNLRLQAGMQTVVNLTMNAIFDADNWLPTQRRRADEPVDDWKWTLRSTANRPLLRLVDEDGAHVSSSGEHAHTATTEGRVTVTSGDGTFGDGGTHQALLLERSIGGSEGAVLRADVGQSRSLDSPGPSVTLSTGYEKRTAFGGSTRLVAGMQSHPELTNGSMPGFGPGFELLQMASSDTMAFGDAVVIDVGTLMEAERLEATRLQAEPYVRVTVRPTDDVIVEYRYATGRTLQSSEDLDRLKPTVTAVADAQGRPLGDKGRHNELSISRKLGQDVVSVSGYADTVQYAAINGSGLLTRTQLQGTGVVEDPTTGTLQTAVAGFSGQGVSVSWMHPLTPALSAWAEYDLGKALTSGGGAVPLSDLQQSLSAQVASAASVAVRGKVLRTGTSLKAEYRWQPLRTLTQVNAYNATAEEAYLSFFLRQRLWCGRLLPQGVDAVIEATNLLEQGYQPVLAPDGHTLFLAQVPRGIQGGFAFNF